MSQGYETRQYPSVKWACTQVTYEAEEGEMEAEEGEIEAEEGQMEVEEGEMEATATPSGEVDLIQMMEYMKNRKKRRGTPQGKMFKKIFRYIFDGPSAAVAVLQTAM